MTRISIFAAIATLTLSAPASFAGNAGASLGDCYNHVISACNQTNHPIPCSESGMDACDEVHTASTAGGTLKKLKVLRGNGVLKFRAVPVRGTMIMPSGEGSENRDRNAAGRG